MINNSTAGQPWYNDLQNCYVDPTNPYNPYPTTFPWYPGQQPPITITTADSTAPASDEEKSKPSSTFAPFIIALSEQDKAALSAMIRRVIKEEVDAVVRDVLSDRDEADRRERWCDEW
jgi:hypothetical protein